MPNDVQGAVCPKIEGGVCDVERRLAGATDPDASEGIDGDRVGAIGMAARVVDARSQASVCVDTLKNGDGLVLKRPIPDAIPMNHQARGEGIRSARAVRLTEPGMLVCDRRRAFAMLGMKRALRVGSFGLFLIANPAYFTACGSADEEFSYGEAEMVELIESASSAQALPLGSYSLKLELQQADGEVVAYRAAPPGWIRSANACQTRSFVKSAAACSSDSTMPITGTATLTDASDDGSGEPIAVISVQGSMFAGLNLDSATLEIWFEEGTASVHWHEAEGFSVNSFHATAVGTGRLDIDYRGNG